MERIRHPSAVSATGIEARGAETRVGEARCVAREPGPEGGRPAPKRRLRGAPLQIDTRPPCRYVAGCNHASACLPTRRGRRIPMATIGGHSFIGASSCRSASIDETGDIGRLETHLNFEKSERRVVEGMAGLLLRRQPRWRASSTVRARAKRQSECTKDDGVLRHWQLGSRGTGVGTWDVETLAFDKRGGLGREVSTVMSARRRGERLGQRKTG